MGACHWMVDAIVVLTGGKGRAEEGLLLRQEGWPFDIGGVNEDADAGSIFFYRLSAESQSIVLDKVAFCMKTRRGGSMIRRG